jgi:hypothetical protein
MAIFDRFLKRATVAPVSSPQPSVTPTASALGLPANRRLFESQSLDGEINVSRVENDMLQLHFAAAKARFPGPVYLEWLQFFHRFVEPRNYLEIGVESGASFAFAQPPTLAVGVDPLLEIKHELKARHKLYSQTSDEFFTTQDVAAVFEGEVIALAFVDGMHTFDQALKDFIHVERHAARESIVLFHDIFPLNAVTASRERRSVFWCGDTWKAIVLLRTHRPDLKVFTIPTYPSGLAVVTNLNPGSTLLLERFETLYSEARELAFDGHGQVMSRHLNEIANEPRIVVELLNG